MERGNPYVVAGQTPATKRSLVAYVDILGFREYVQGSENSDDGTRFLEAVQKACEKAYPAIRLEPNDVCCGGQQVKTFSDNVVVGLPFDFTDKAATALWELLQDVAALQLLMSLEGFFVRGAIAIGPLYVDRNIVFGSGLIEAYDIERKVAVFPRLVLAPMVLPYLDKHRKSGDSEYFPYLLKDTDGQTFVNYLLSAQGNDGVTDAGALRKHKAVVEAKLSKHAMDTRTLHKYRWVAHYHNYFGEEHCPQDRTVRVAPDAMPSRPSPVA